MIDGTVEALFRWPVKSVGGERLRACRLDRNGLLGDRAHALLDRGGARGGEDRLLTARQAPGMLRWSAAYLDEADDALADPEVARPVLTAPDGERLAWDDPRLAARLAEDLGRPVALQRDPSGALHDLPRSVLVTTEATRTGVERALGRPVDVRRFRTNLHLRLDAPPGSEAGWEGGRITVGDVELELLHPCERCAIPTREPGTGDRWPQLARWLVREHENRFGINARVVRGGRIAVGDTVAVIPPERGPTPPAA